MNYFDEVVVFTDLHLGLKNNSKVHNEDCVEFIQYLIDTAKQRNIKKCIFCGDFHHIRPYINIFTLRYSLKVLKMLSDSFDEVIMIRGNHDEYYKDKREITSIEYARYIKNIKIIDEPFYKDGVAFIPFLMGDEYKSLDFTNIKYVFGHLELPGFILNNRNEYNDSSKLTAKELTKPTYIFSGHFHKRQIKDNIIYMGNCFPHNQGDSLEESERGFMILKWGEEPEFFNWKESPNYRSLPYSMIIENCDVLLNDKSYVKAFVDIDIKVNDQNYIKDLLCKTFNVREFTFSFQKNINITDNTNMEDIKFEHIDQIVIDVLNQVESEVLDNNKLISLYNDLDCGNFAIEYEE